jgi:hypothetical protein
MQRACCLIAQKHAIAHQISMIVAAVARLRVSEVDLRAAPKEHQISSHGALAKELVSLLSVVAKRCILIT